MKGTKRGRLFYIKGCGHFNFSKPHVDKGRLELLRAQRAYHINMNLSKQISYPTLAAILFSILYFLFFVPQAYAASRQFWDVKPPAEFGEQTTVQVNCHGYVGEIAFLVGDAGGTLLTKGSPPLCGASFNLSRALREAMGSFPAGTEFSICLADGGTTIGDCIIKRDGTLVKTRAAISFPAVLPSPGAPGGAADILQSITPPKTVIEKPDDMIQKPLDEVARPFRFSQWLGRGYRGEDVQRLQEFLAKNPALYPEGFVTGYFGPLTEQAIRRFQEKHGIVSSGDPQSTGFGMVGPRTLKKLNEVFAKEAYN